MHMPLPCMPAAAMICLCFFPFPSPFSVLWHFFQNNLNSILLPFLFMHDIAFSLIRQDSSPFSVVGVSGWVLLFVWNPVCLSVVVLQPPYL